MIIRSVPWFPDADRHPESRETTPRCRLQGTESADLATKQDLKAEIADLRSELKAAIADLRSELRQTELRLEAKIEAIKADILNRVFGLILGTLVVNIVAIVGAMFAVAKLVRR